ncbi:hypothetical protein BC943DRAFT_319375 [Umbelopsis sp. AD052]|nr:hypothetical protein BC943DRAFT_319375 [Umbelopsis sp. AD052]
MYLFMIKQPYLLNAMCPLIFCSVFFIPTARLYDNYSHWTRNYIDEKCWCIVSQSHTINYTHAMVIQRDTLTQLNNRRYPSSTAKCGYKP